METLFDSLVTLAAVVTIGTYIWSVRGHFSSPSLPPGAKLLSAVVLLGAAGMIVLVWHVDQPVLAAAAGLALQLASNLLFWSAIGATRSARLLSAFTEDNPHGLVRSGPYRYVRHPFYTSYILFWAGFAVAAWSPWGVVPVIGLSVAYYRAAVEEEQKFSRTAMAADYAAYMQTTGRFFPRRLARLAPRSADG